jgi:hypothetical protein
MSLCNCLHEIKVLTGYSSNVFEIVNIKILKLCLKKSHENIESTFLRHDHEGVFVFQRNFTKGRGSNEAIKTLR